MMGRTHATSGAVAWMAAAPLMPTLLDVTPGPVGLAVGLVAAAGAAMLPDFDHHHATIAQSLGPVTKVIAAGVGAISGGHRNGTHSVLGLAVFTATAFGLATLGGWPLGIFLGFLFAIAAAALRVEMAKATIAHTIICVAAAVALLLLAGNDVFPPLVVAPAVAVGVAAHIVGDMLTKEGCPLAWPVSKLRLKVLTLTTDGPVERLVIGPALGVAALVLLAIQTGLLEPGGLTRLVEGLLPDWGRSPDTSVGSQGGGGLLETLRRLLA